MSRIDQALGDLYLEHVLFEQTPTPPPAVSNQQSPATTNPPRPPAPTNPQATPTPPRPPSGPPALAKIVADTVKGVKMFCSKANIEFTQAVVAEISKALDLEAAGDGEIKGRKQMDQQDQKSERQTQSPPQTDNTPTQPSR